jgi:hypothetical protein
MLKKYTFLSACLFLAALAGAQSPAPVNPCGTTGISPWLKWYAQNRDQLAAGRENDTAWLYVPLTAHLVGKDNGAGYFPLEKLLNTVCEMNAQFEDAHIRYYLHPEQPIVYHDNSSWFEHDWDGGAEMIEASHLPGRLNAFVVDDPAGNCGYAGWDAIVLGIGCSAPGDRTWAHEAGHHLSLPHPFVGWEGFSWDYAEAAPDDIDGHPVERMDGTNCGFSGDYFCDTPPDYLNYRWSCDSNAQSTVLQHDPAGVEFRSDATLIMGYSSDACGARFTDEQIEAMRYNLLDPNSGHNAYLQLTELPAPLSPDATVELVAPVDTQTVQYNDITLQWNLLPGASIHTVEVGFFPSMNPKLFSQTFFDNTTSVHLPNSLPNNRTLYWRVKAYNTWDPCFVNTPTQVGVFRTSNLTATNELERLALAELSPNPAAAGETATLLVTTDETMPASLRLVDASGRPAYQSAVQLSPGGNRLDVPTTGLPAGLYNVILQNEKGVITRRIAVN